jgi:hypothetical protein
VKELNEMTEQLQSECLNKKGVEYMSPPNIKMDKKHNQTCYMLVKGDGEPNVKPKRHF